MNWKNPFRRNTVDLLSPRGRRVSKDLIKEAKQIGKARQSLFGLALAFAIVAVAALVPGPLAAAVIGLGAFGFTPLVKALPDAGILGLSTPRLLNYVPGIQGVASSGTGTVNAPVDRRYHSLRILTTNAAGALTDPTTIVSLVELVVNGVVMRTGLPATFINIAKTYRYTPGTGEIPIFFTEFWRNETPRAAEATSWDLFGQSTFVIRLTFLAPGGGVGVQSILADFDGKRNVRRNAQGQMVPFLAIVKQFDNAIVGASGTNDIMTIPTNFPLQRIYLDVSANAISSVQVFADNNVKVWEATKTENQYLLNANDITATFFEYPLVFDYDARIDSNLKTSNLQVRVVTTGAATITAHIHQLVGGFM
jgi:hypothetical protein